MSTAARLILGIVIGILVSLLTLVMSQMLMNVLAERTILGTTLTVLMLLLGMLLGAVSVGLSYITAGKERTVLVMLVGVGLAALVVMVGGYGNRSLLPVGIYGLALLGSYLIARATAILGEPAEGQGNRNLQM